MVSEQRIKQSLILNNIVCRGDHWSPFFIAVDNRNWTVENGTTMSHKSHPTVGVVDSSPQGEPKSLSLRRGVTK